MSTHTPEDPSSSSIVPYDEGDPQLCFQQETRRDAPPIINISGHARVQLGDQHTYTSSQNAVQQLITSLHYPEIVQRYETIEENHGTTCHWILHPPAFQEVQWDFFVEWLQSDQSLYWISGKPGSGKSTLMKYLVEHVSELDIYQDQQPIILSCWFWEAGSSFQHNLLGALRSLLWQLLHCYMAKDIAESIRSSEASSAFAWTKSRLMDNIRTSIRTYLDKHETVFIFLDGLDECTSEGVKILDTVERLSTDFAGLKICVSSRPEQTYVHAFKHLPALRLQDLNRHDILHYINDKFFADARVEELTRNIHHDEFTNFRESFYDKIEGGRFPLGKPGNPKLALWAKQSRLMGNLDRTIGLFAK